MYQIKCGDGYEIQVIGRGDNGLCRIEGGKNSGFSGTYAECVKWLEDRGIKVDVKGPMQAGRGPI